MSCHYDPIAWWARVTPDKVALIEHARRRWSYAELDRAADGWAAWLARHHVGPDDRVALLAPNRVECVTLFYGCARIGAALVPINWRLAPVEQARIVEDARPTLLLVDDRFAGSRVSMPSTTPSVDFSAAANEAASAGCVPPATCRDVAMVLYTSGSTGRPKGALVTHRQIHFNAIATTTGWQLGADDCGPVTTPFFHTGGWHVFATPLWFRGGTVAMIEAFDPATFLDVLDDTGCTIAFGVPTQFVMLTESAAWGRPLPRLRWFISGGAPCPAALAARVRAAGYRLREGFGLTEFGPNCFAISDDWALRKPGSVGWPVPFVEMKVVDEAGAITAPGEAGELLLRGPQMFGGYLDDPARTAQVMTDDGWLRTGDLASRDEDGAFTIRGRRKDMFISGGENVYPGEVEAALVGCDGVAEAAVVGVPDEKWGEVGHAFVLCRPGHVIESRTLLTILRDRLAHYKIPKHLDVVAELPRTGAGKVDRVALRQGRTS